MSHAVARFKLVIFDLDGTLIDAFEDIAMAANFVRKRSNLPPLTIAEVKEHVGHGARQLVEGVLGSTDIAIIDDNLNALVTFYEELEKSSAVIYDGVVPVLQTLRQQGIYTAVASNKPHTVTIRVMDYLGLAPHVDVVRGETAEIRRKPAPDVLLRTMEDVGCRPEETLMVGDTDIDIRAAQAAGVKVAAVTYGQYSADYLQKWNPDYILTSMSELLPIVFEK